MTFEQFLAKTPKTEGELVTVIAIAHLSVQKEFSHLTPHEIYEHLLASAKNTFEPAVTP